MNCGLEYPPGLLDALQVVPSPSSPIPPPPIRLLPPPLFASLHLQHLLAHPPDHALFPFLHGLEGDNDAQNTFFANAGAGSHWGVGVEVPVNVPPPLMKHGTFRAQPPSLRLPGAPAVPAPHAEAQSQMQVQVQHHQLLRPKVPKYRGLVWVVCEEDVRNGGDKVTMSILRRKEVVLDVNEEAEESDVGSQFSESSFDDDDDDDDDLEEDDDLDFGDDERDSVSILNIVDASTIPIPDTIQTKTKDQLTNAKMDSMSYMHPVVSPHHHHHHSHPQLTSISTSFTHMQAPLAPLSFTTTSTSSLSTSASDSLLTETDSTVATSLDYDTSSTAPTSQSGSPASATLSTGGYPQVIALEEAPHTNPPASATPAANNDLVDSSAGKAREGGRKAKAKTGKSRRTKSKGKNRAAVDPAAPPLLTCTFRPKELLRKRRVPVGARAGRSSKADNTPEDNALQEGDKDTEMQDVWEFVPARIPDGISLRNFGIQVPIYATISDIVVYSPKGPTPAAVALAERFREAVWRKRVERTETLKGIVYSRVYGHQNHNNQQQQPQQQQASHFIKIEDVLNAEKEAKSIRKAKATAVRESGESKSVCDAKQQKSSASSISSTTAAAPPTPAPTSTPTPSSPSPSLSDSDPSTSSSLSSDDDDDDDEDLETRMLDTAERYILSLVKDDLLGYNVFVLDADEEEMRGRGGMAHLMMRSCGEGVPGGVDHGRSVGVQSQNGDADAKRQQQERKKERRGGGSRRRGGETGAHTIGSDGELKGEREVEEGGGTRARSRSNSMRQGGEVDDVFMEVDNTHTTEDSGMMVIGDMDIDSGIADRDADIIMLDVQKRQRAAESNKPINSIALIPNTVNFALREKEEMRDLTKASEIISLFPVSASLYSRGKTAFLSPSSSPPPPTPSPPHLQHLTGLIPPSRASSVLGSSATLPSDSSRQQQQQTMEYTFTHADSAVDISSPATFFDPLVGQVFLGNSGDVPLAANAKKVNASGDGGVLRGGHRVGGSGADDDDNNEEEEGLLPDDPFNCTATNDPASGFGYDICIECHELAPFPTLAHVRAAEENLGVLEMMWKGRCVEREKARRMRENGRGGGNGNGNEHEDEEGGEEDGEEEEAIVIPPRPPPHANAVIHLPFPSSPPNTQQTMAQLIPILRFLEKWIRPVPGAVKVEVEVGTKKQRQKQAEEDEEEGEESKKATTPTPGSHERQQQQHAASGVRRWSSSVASLMPSVFGGSSSSGSSSTSMRSRSFTTPAPSSTSSSHNRRNSSSPNSAGSTAPQTHPTRPLKLLLYSADGYTESSLAALCLLMSVKGLTLPEAYLELQVSKRRSFFVYGHDLGVVRRVEGRFLEERERQRERMQREREKVEMERMVREAREREVREREVREQQQQPQQGVMVSLGEEEEEAGALNVNGKRTIGSVHAVAAGAPPAVPTVPAEKHVGSGLSLFRVFGGSASSSSSVTTAAAASAAPTTTTTRTPPSLAGVTAGGKPQHAFTGRPAAKSVSFSQVPTWGQRPQPSPSQQPQVRVPPTIPQGVEAFRPPEEYTGSLPGSAMQQSSSCRKCPATSQNSVGGVGSQSNRGSGGGGGGGGYTGTKRPRANTSPWLPSFFGGDHRSWFNDPRFDGSFPSRVLPFLYLGNLNHASNVYMLHALGITHVVSVGECALLPPPYHMVGHSGGNAGGGANGASGVGSVISSHPGGHHGYAGGGGGGSRSGHGSLWIEEREGRIKVLDIKGVCDDGIDTLEPQLEPICEWIDKAREEGGQVLVHCRVGVSRSATVTIAYVMKHLSLPLVDAYLIVRSRRLSVLIQPNMRLLYNLCGWEVKLAKERAGWVEEDVVDGSNESRSTALVLDYVSGERKEKKEMVKRLERELARTLTWPYLSMEVHKLNEKYLH